MPRARGLNNKAMISRKKSKQDEIKVSVVINTCNRGAYLSDTLEGLKQQTYNNFEVIIVNGPSIDNTEEVAKKFNVRYYTAPFNISISRNIGIKNAAGEIIAFIDDDAVPEPSWLSDIVTAYKDPKIGAVGGRVYNSNGSGFQYNYGMIDSWGYPHEKNDGPYSHNNPNGEFFNINIGTNASYKRTALIEVGGFDEEIEYYHDESDVCVRLIKAGYRVEQLESAYVHHKMAPSYRRKSSTKVMVWDAIVKNTIYFALKHTEHTKPLYKRLLRPAKAEFHKLSNLNKLLFSGDLTLDKYFIRYASLLAAYSKGYKRGFYSDRKLIKNYKFQPSKFKRYIKSDLKNDMRLNIVLVNQGFPPEQTDGNSRHNGALAKELVARGHRVFVISKSYIPDETISYLNGCWVYRHNPEKHFKHITGYERVDRQLAHSKSVYRTIGNLHEKADVILVSVWDVEGMTILKHKLAPTILSLMSPLKKVVETQWFNVDDPSFEITYELEKFCIKNADAVMPISDNIKQTIGDLYSVNWSNVSTKTIVRTIPLGVDQQFESDLHSAKSADVRKDNFINILYVGRFERRKGIDLLLSAIPGVLMNNKKVRFELVGDKSLVDENGKSYFNEFEKKYKNEKWYDRVLIPGFVDEETLVKKYQDCDIFVAPSRYESFGQIFIEAMAMGKPCIGSRVGGIPEVVEDGVTGLLFESENSIDLQEKLEKLIRDKSLRIKMSKNAKQTVKTKFSSKVWGDNFLRLVNDVIHRDTY